MGVALTSRSHVPGAGGQGETDAPARAAASSAWAWRRAAIVTCAPACLQGHGDRTGGSSGAEHGCAPARERAA